MTKEEAINGFKEACNAAETKEQRNYNVLNQFNRRSWDIGYKNYHYRIFTNGLSKWDIKVWADPKIQFKNETFDLSELEYKELLFLYFQDIISEIEVIHPNPILVKDVSIIIKNLSKCIKVCLNIGTDSYVRTSIQCHEKIKKYLEYL